MITSKDFIN